MADLLTRSGLKVLKVPCGPGGAQILSMCFIFLGLQDFNDDELMFDTLGSSNICSRGLREIPREYVRTYST